MIIDKIFGLNYFRKMAGVVNLSDATYPKLLKDTPNPPKILYYKGEYSNKIFNNCVAVVGSRKMSIYGKKVVEHIFSTLSKDITIVSGFMTGVDSEAHKQALRFGLKTIAVMPCGIDYIHPEDQSNLYLEIIQKGGLIVSEYEGDFKPKIWTYPRRNRIVAGLSKVTIIIEAALNSGSLITARFSNSYDRKVFVVPGSIFSNLSLGKIQVSNEFANSINSGFQINEYLNISYLSNVDESSEFDSSHIILKSLRDEPMTINELSQYLSKDISNLSNELTLLSIDGKIAEQGGKFHAC